MHKLLKIISRTLLSLVLLVIANYFLITFLASPYLDNNKLTLHTVGLVFGTSKSTIYGGKNLFFYKRIEHAVRLYQAGKIEYILVSGDNRSANYNESSDMRDALVERGIPSEKIVLDYAGLSTRDSVARAKLIFGTDDLLLISQKFQVQRAIIACMRFDISCQGSSSDDVSIGIAAKVYLREFGARLKVRYNYFVTPYPTIGGKKEITPWSSSE